MKRGVGGDCRRGKVIGRNFKMGVLRIQGVANR